MKDNKIINTRFYRSIQAALNEKDVENAYLFSSSFSDGHGLSVIHENFTEIVTLFTARKSIKQNWINDKDEYLTPDTGHPEWQKFVDNSIIYSLFNNSSQQSSLRQVEYKDKLWDIKNEFFWMSKQHMQELADTIRFDEMYHDARTSEDRYVFNRITEGLDCSDLAWDVYNEAHDLVVMSMEYRKLMHSTNPEYHLQAWDAGYAQLKLVWKKFMPNEFKEFRELYKEFENELRPMVYELGFLIK